MGAMRMIGSGRSPRPHGYVRQTPVDYVVELDVADFAASELSVEVVGPVVTVRGNQVSTGGDDRVPFRLHERLEESFRLPDDADASVLKVAHRDGTLELRTPRKRLVPRVVRVERPRRLVNPAAEPC
jgi:HSP20 family molecular chaperone IbpA